MDNIIKNAKYSIVESIDPRLVEVVVTFSLDGEVRQHYIFLRKKNGTPRQTYLKQAEAQFKKDLETDKINAARRALGNKNRRKPGLVFFFAFATCAAMSMAGLFTYQYLTQPVTPGGGGGGDEPVPEGTVPIVPDEKTKGEMTFSPNYVEKGEEYKGVVTLKNTNKAVDTSLIKITVDGKALQYGFDYTFTMKDSKSNAGTFQYDLTIVANKTTTDEIDISVPTGIADKFKTTQDVFKDSFGFKNDKNMSLYIVEMFDDDSQDNTYIDFTPTANFMKGTVNEMRTYSIKYQTPLSVDDPTVGHTSYKNNGISKLYAKTINEGGEDDYYTTPSNFEYHTYVNLALSTGEVILADQFKFNNNLTYENKDTLYVNIEPYPGVEITVTIYKFIVMFYNDKIISTYMDVDMPIEGKLKFSIVYNYNANTVTAPSDNQTYEEELKEREGGVMRSAGIDNFKTVFPALINQITDDESISYNTENYTKESTDSFEFYYDANKICYEDLSTDPSEINYLNKDGDEYYRYLKDDSGEWQKKTTSEDDYKEWSFELPREVFKQLLQVNFNKIQEEEKVHYESAEPIEGVTIRLYFDIYAYKKSWAETVLDRISLVKDVQGKELSYNYQNFISDGRVSVTLPEVK